MPEQYLTYFYFRILFYAFISDFYKKRCFFTLKPLILRLFPLNQAHSKSCFLKE